MVQRSPDSMEALMTSTNPVRSKAVSPYTSSTRPQEMMATTPARCQRACRAGGGWLLGHAAEPNGLHRSESGSCQAARLLSSSQARVKTVQAGAAGAM